LGTNPTPRSLLVFVRPSSTVSFSPDLPPLMATPLTLPKAYSSIEPQ
jgi:hypothetical protein